MLSTCLTKPIKYLSIKLYILCWERELWPNSNRWMSIRIMEVHPPEKVDARACEFVVKWNQHDHRRHLSVSNVREMHVKLG